jgi:hypothetical protein
MAGTSAVWSPQLQKGGVWWACQLEESKLLGRFTRWVGYRMFMLLLAAQKTSPIAEGPHEIGFDRFMA